MKKFELRDGHELRGFMIRLYPTKEDEAALAELQHESRIAWNWMVGQKETARDAAMAFAVRSGLIESRPVRPDFNGMTPEQSSAEAAEFREASFDWIKRFLTSTKSTPECQAYKLKEWQEHLGVKYDYQLLTKVIGWSKPEVKSGAHLLQALVKAFFTKSDRRKKRRRSIDPMPIRVMSGACFALGSFGDRRGAPFYNCQVKINGLKIRGRLPGVVPSGRVIEGVSLTKKADGWWASVKQEVPKKEINPGTPGSVVGIDVGLDNVAAVVALDGAQWRVENKRGKAFAERIAGRQAMKLPTGRIELQAARHAKYVLHNEVVLPLAQYETIKVERLPAHIGQMGSVKKSGMRAVVDMLRQRYGDRVREVDPRFTSQDCSQCGHRSKETWSYEHGRFGECPSCGHREDRDLNAARNIALRDPILLGS
jgi:putative transposase